VAQLLTAGCTRHNITKAIADGRALSPHRGVLALPGARRDAILASVLGAELTCISALAHYGLPLRRTVTAPHLGVRDGLALRGRDSDHARLHYQVAPVQAGGVSSVAHALDVAGACIDPLWHLVAVDAALNRGLVTGRDLLAFSRTRSERKEFLLAFADARAEAPGETIARLPLVQAGLRVRPQAYVEGSGRVDIEVEGVAVVQVDGYGPHSDRASFTRDREKSRAVMRAGRPQLSYAAAEFLGPVTPNIVHDVRVALDAWRTQGRPGVGPSLA
jgi:hypothetical protein